MPIKTYGADGTTVYFDSDDTSGICLGSYSIPANTTWSKSWPLLAGATIRVSGTWNSQAGLTTISYPNSIPTLEAASTTYDRILIVWATGTPTISGSGYGIQAVNTSGVIALSPAGRGMNYIGTASYYSVVNNFGTPNPNAFADMGYWVVRVESSTQPIGVPVLTDGRYIRFDNFWLVSGTTWQGYIRAVDTAPAIGSAWPTLQQPTIHCFAVPPSPGSGAQCALYDTDGTLAYDLLANKLARSWGAFSITPGDNHNSASVTLPSFSGTVGFLGTPNFTSTQFIDNVDAEYSRAAFWRRSGTTMYLDKLIYSTEQYPGSTSTSIYYAGTVAAYGELINLSGY